ncbi:hypothetical protein WHI96_27135 [Pseudonocardia tropica]|uniref:Abi-like protein n=1 Tax=Pseudonocardia tropica TaxID=681289 RepID=A0ABV1K2Q8_9PSEU
MHDGPLVPDSWGYIGTETRPWDLPRPELVGPVGRPYDLRNRVAHNEPLIGRNLAARHADILTVAGLLSSELRDHVAARSSVLGVLADRP